MSKILIFLFSLTYLLSGCATAPKPGVSATYNLSGTAYVALTPLCDQAGIAWRYDQVTNTVSLDKAAHQVKLRLGDKLVLLDGVAQQLEHPADIYRGIIVVPRGFKEQILDKVFQPGFPPAVNIPAFLKIKKVVVDPGHGGKMPGAIAKSGLREKDVNLDIAKRLKKLLEAQGMEVIMTRSADRDVALAKRAEIANNAKADLFLSIHSNANRVKSMNGFEVYYVSPTVSDNKRALTAAKDEPLPVDSSSLASSAPDLKIILWDMIYTSSRAESIEIARAICKDAEGSLGVNILGVKPARYEVLRETNMPAVLVEVGFLSNKGEERKLKNGFYRQQIAEAIARGLQDYSGGRT